MYENILWKYTMKYFEVIFHYEMKSMPTIASIYICLNFKNQNHALSITCIINKHTCIVSYTYNE